MQSVKSVICLFKKVAVYFKILSFAEMFCFNVIRVCVLILHPSVGMNLHFRQSLLQGAGTADSQTQM